MSAPSIQSSTIKLCLKSILESVKVPSVDPGGPSEPGILTGLGGNGQTSWLAESLNDPPERRTTRVVLSDG